MINDTRQDIISSPPPGKVRSLISVIIALFIIWQILLPASYYLGADPDIYDERFSWRMFSSTIQQTCIFNVNEDIRSSDGNAVTKRVDLSRTIDQIWIDQVAKNVQPVIRKLLNRRCKNNPMVSEVHFTRNCRTPGSFNPVPGDRISLDCDSGKYSTTIREIR